MTLRVVTEIEDVYWDYLCEKGYVPTALRNRIQREGREDEALDIIEEACGFVVDEDNIIEFINEELAEIMGIDLGCHSDNSSKQNIKKKK